MESFQLDALKELFRGPEKFGLQIRLQISYLDPYMNSEIKIENTSDLKEALELLFELAAGVKAKDEQHIPILKLKEVVFKSDGSVPGFNDGKPKVSLKLHMPKDFKELCSGVLTDIKTRNRPAATGPAGTASATTCVLCISPCRK